MKFTFISVVLVLALLCNTPLSAQEITGNIEGRIFDEEGNAILLATVSVAGPTLQGSRAVISSPSVPITIETDLVFKLV